MASIRRGLRALLALAAVFVGSAALAQSFDHRVYLDLDNNPATGCSVTTAAGAVNGAELRLTATVTGLPPTVTSATRETCSAGSFGSPQAQASGYPVGLGNGSGGADVVEFSTLLDGLGASGTARLIFVSSSATGADLASGTLALPGLAVASQPAVIPSTGLLALILLAGVVFWLARKHPGFGTSVAVLLLLGAGVVWAANFIVDGQVADWTGVSPLSADAGNDASSGEPQIELVQVFAATEAGRLFARADLSDTQSAAPVFNSAATATFTTGSPGTFSVTAAGIPTPTLSLSGGTLPTGVGFNAATGVLSGTPTAGTGGSYPLQFSATNSQGTTTQNFNLVVNQAPVVTSATATTFIAGAPGSFTVTASGFPAPTFALTGTLPSGITLDPGSGVLSGTASSGSGGSYPVTITATNVAGSSAPQSFTLTINDGPVFTSAASTTFSVGSAGSFTVAASGTPTPTLSLSNGTLPTGVSFVAATGVLSGTPALGTGGAYALEFSATNVQGTTTQAFTLNINEAPAITSANATTFTVGNVSSFTVAASGFPAPSFALSGTLPSGITFDTTSGVLGGTPAAGSGGSYALSFTATNVAGSSAAQSFTLSINDGPVFTSANTTTFSVGVAGNFSVTASGTPTPTLSLSNGTLPTGVTFNAGSGVLSGTPAAGSGGSHAIEFSATNVQGTSTQAFTLLVNESPTITSANAATFTVGAGGSFTFTAAGFPASTFALGACVPALPVTISLNPGTGVLSGTPASGEGGSYACTVTASNGVAPNASQGFTLTIEQAPQITSANAANFLVGTNGSFTVTATGTPTPTLSIAGSLPSGVSFAPATGLISGTPAAGTGGSYPITVTASNGVLPNAVQNFTLTVNEAPQITSANSATFTLNNLGSFTVTANGFPAASFAITGTLPTGVSFNPGTGVLSGTPTSAGTFPLTFEATNVAGSSAVQNFTLSVNDGPVFTSANTTTFSVGASGNFSVTATGTPTPTLSLSNGTLPTGLSFNAGSGLLSGTPAAGTGGSHTLEFSATNVQGTSTQAFTLLVNESPTITSANASTFTVGAASSFTFTAAGFPASTFALSGCTLPGTISLNPGTGVLSGTPTPADGGSYACTVTASNGVLPDATQSFTLTINQAPAITSANTTTFTVGSAGSFTVTATGTPTPAIALTGSIPSGVTYTDNGNGTATLGGTPSAGTGGTYVLTFTASNGVPPNGTQSFTLNVNEAPAITSAANATFTTGINSSFTVTTSGLPTPSLTLGGAPLPSGLTFVDNGDGTGSLSGTPAAGTGGTYALTFTATNVVGSSAPQAFTLTVNQAPGITSATSTGFTVGTAGSFTITTTGFPAPVITRTGAALPAGVTYTDNGDGTATLSGTPGAGSAGAYAFTFTATNSTAPAANQSFTLNVNQPPAITSATSDTFIVGTPDSFTVTTTGFPTPTLSLAGTLPTGVTFTPGTGVLGGTAIQIGSFPITFGASNGIPPDASQNFTLNVVCPAITVNPATMPEGLFQTAYPGATFTQSGSTGGSITWSAAGLPAGLSIDLSGQVSGTPTTTVLNASVTITATDNFGCSGSRATTITVRPTTDNESYTGGVGNTQYVVGATAPSTPHVMFADNVKTGDNGPGMLSVTLPPTSANGTIAEGGTDGTFTYTPNTGFAGPTDTFTYTLTDGNGVTNTGTVTMNLSGMVWYVNSAGAAGDGRSHSPFNTLNAAGTPSAANSTIYVHSGGATTTGNLTMDASQTLHGAGASFTLNDLTIAAATRPTLTGTVTLANTTVVRALNFTPGAGIAALTATGTTGSITVDQVDATGGTNSLSLTNASGAVNVTSANFTNSSGAEVLISGGSAGVNIGATISSNAGRSVDIQSRTAGTVTFSGPITDTGTGIMLNANTGSTVNFTGALTLNTGTNTAFTATGGGSVSTTATGSTITTTTATALNVTNTNIGAGNLIFRSISSNGAASGIVLNATGASGGLTVTGNSAGQCGGGVSSPTPPATIVAPVLADCTGGSILASTNAGINLINTRNVSLTRMRIANGADDGIRGDRVVGFTLASSLVDNNGPIGSPTFYNNLDFGDDSQDLNGLPPPNPYDVGWNGLTGTASITNSTIRNGSNNNVLIRSRDTAGGVLSLTMTGNVIAGNPANALMNDGVLLESGETANMSATFSGNIFTASKGDHVQVAALNSGDANVLIQNNTMTGGHSTALGQGITINAATGVAFGGYTGRIDYDINGNNIQGAISNGVSVVLGTSAVSAVFDGFVRNNLIGTSGAALSCSTQANGVYIDARGNGTHTSAVTGNTIRQCFDRGILSEAGDGDSVLNLTVQSNIIDQQVDANAREAIQTNFGITTTNVFGNIDTNAVCLQLGGAGALANTFSHGAGAPDDFRLRKRFEATVRLPSYAGGTTQGAGDLAQVVAFIQGQNTGSAGEPGSASASGAGGGYSGGAACPQPTP